MSDENATAPGTPTDGAVKGKKHTAGALDIRNIIGGLLFVYGVILLLMGLFGDQETDKTGGINANLWAGLGLLIVGGAFLTWARVKPLMVPSTAAVDDAGPGGTEPAPGEDVGQGAAS